MLLGVFIKYGADPDMVSCNTGAEVHKSKEYEAIKSFSLEKQYIQY